MFDENSPEVINYVNHKLKEQALNIAEKILDNYGDFYIDVIEKCISISDEGKSQTTRLSLNPFLVHT